MNTSKKILVVDDELLIRKGIINIIATSNRSYTLYEANSMQTAINTAMTIKPDLILMDLQLGDGTGAEACRIIKDKHPKTDVLFLSIYDDEVSILAAMLSGACGYLVKDIKGETLLQAISLTLKGFAVFNQKSLPFLLKNTKTDKINNKNNQLNELSSQQKKVLEHVTLGLTNKEIGKAMNLSDKTIRNYLSIIFEKLGISKRVEAAIIYKESSQENE